MCACEPGVTCRRCREDDDRDHRPDDRAELERELYERDRQRLEDTPDA